MDFIDNFYANFFTLGALIPCIFYLFLSFFLLSIQDKSKASFHLGMATVGMTLFNLAYFIAGSIYHPGAAFHRWLTVGVIMLAETHSNMFMYYLHSEKYPRLARTLLILQYALSIFITAVFYFKTINAGKIFNFAGHYWDFNADDISRLVGIFIMFYIFIFIIIMVWKLITVGPEARLIILALGISYLVISIVPSITNILSRDGALDRGTYQITWDMFNILGFSLLTVLYINYTKDRTKFLGKIIGISMVSIMVVLQGFTYYSSKDQENSYDAIHQIYTRLFKESRYRSNDVDYIVNFSPKGKDTSLIYKSNNEVGKINFNKYKYEYLNTLVWEKIDHLPDKNHLENLKKLLNNGHVYFDGYKKAILYFADTLKPNDVKRSKKVLNYIRSLKRVILYRKNKIKRLEEENFREEIIDFVKSQQGDFKPFGDAIYKYLSASTLEGSKLKSRVLRFLSPFAPAGARHYREHERTHYISFMYADTENDIIYESGFSYLKYRIYLHPTSMKFIIMMGVVLFVIVVGFRFLFLGAFVNPLNMLLDAMHKVRTGDLDIEVPVKVEDEVGYITTSFNKMLRTIRAGKLRLDRYAATLEKRVEERTEELQAAAHELEAMNESLVTINDQLIESQRIAGMDMKMAVNVQTSFFPNEPPKTELWDVAYLFKPMSGISGDMYDFYVENGTLLGLSLFDVSGHGIASGLITMLAKSIIHRKFSTMKNERLNNIVESINDELIDEIGDVDNYLTGLMLRFDNNIVECVNAGHAIPLLLRRETGKVVPIETKDKSRAGMFLGIEMMRDVYVNLKFKMEAGDYLLIFSDCLIENKNDNGDEFGMDRVVQALENSSADSTEDRLTEIMDEFYSFVKTRHLSDDLTVIIIKKNGLIKSSPV